MKYLIYTDGGSRGNPGPAAAAFILKSETGKTILEEGSFLGEATNNEAEYTAVIKALQRLIADNTDLAEIDLEFRADSQLIVNQLMGVWKIKNGRIAVLHKKAKELEEKFGNVLYKYIPRDLNFEADFVVNLTLDKNLKK